MFLMRQAFVRSCRMGVAAALPVSNGVHAYDKAASAGLLPQPQPCYEGAVREDAETDACDISWRLIQLSAATESETAGTPQQTLTQLLRPAGYTPQRLDCLLAWQVLQVLMAIGAVPTTGQPSPQQVRFDVLWLSAGEAKHVQHVNKSCVL